MPETATTSTNSSTYPRAYPAPFGACLEKRRLLQEFVVSASTLNRIENAQVVAALSGDGFQFQAELEQALAHKQKAKYAVLAHQENHGC
jgi:hypothetical protein